MTALASLPTFSVEISFTPPFSTPSWVDITQWVQEGETSAGRQHETGVVDASTLRLTLDNRDGRFFPWNTSGPYYGMGGTGLVPEMPIRVNATWASTSYEMFYGYVDSWIPKWKNPGSPDMVISATDMFGLLAVDQMNFPTYPNSVLASSPVGYWRLGDPVDSIVALDSSGLGNNAPLTPNAYGSPNTEPVFGAPGLITTSIATGATFNGGSDDQSALLLPAGLVNSSAPGITLEMLFQGGGSGSGTTNYTYVYSIGANAAYLSVQINPAGGGYTSGVQLYNNYPTGGLLLSWGAAGNLYDNNTHHIMVTCVVSTGVYSLYVDGTLVAVTGTGHIVTYTGGALSSDVGTSFNSFNLTIQEVALYETALSGTVANAHYQAATFGDAVVNSGVMIAEIASTFLGIPSGMLNLVVGVSEIQPLQPGSTLATTKVLDLLQQINGTENGLLWQDPGGVLHFLDRHSAISEFLTSQATFEDSPSSPYFYVIDGFAPGLDNLDLWNEVIGNAQQDYALGVIGSQQYYENTASQAQYGKRTYPNAPTLLCTTDAEALSYCQWIGTIYNQPEPRIRSITLSSNATSAAGAAGVNLPAMLGLLLWQRVTVIYNGLVNSTPLTQVEIIEGIQHSFKANPGELRTTFRLSPVGTTPWMILDDPTYGQLGTDNCLAY